MPSSATALLWGSYTFFAAIFFLNCTMELVTKGQRPGLTTILLSVFWPLTLLMIMNIVSIQNQSACLLGRKSLD